jgi:aspartyl/asparaginyl beta-hydroxylase (cupin superfamily)
MNWLKRALLFFRRNVGLYNLSSFWNPFYDLFTGGRRRPVFFDIDRTFPSLRKVDAAYGDVRAECERLLEQQDLLPKYHELDTNLLYSSARHHRDKRWNVFMLYCYGAWPEQSRQLCPKTCAVLDGVPYLNQAFFSILDPGKSIPEHTGSTRAYIRYHLALRVPANHPPSIRVKDQTYSWKEGESILFDDSWPHEITNHADAVRAVLIIDVVRPLPLPVLAATLLLRKVTARLYAPRIIANANAFKLKPMRE